MNSEKNHKGASKIPTEEHLIINLGLKADAKLFYTELKNAAYELDGAFYDEKTFWNHITKKVRRSYGYSSTEYTYENKGLNLLGNTELVLDRTFVNLLARRPDEILHFYNACLIRSDSETNAINEVHYEVNYGACALTKTEVNSDVDYLKIAKADTVQKLLLYNFVQGKWDEPDRVGAAFMENGTREGFIDIDCKNENPEKVKDLFVRSLTRLYAGIAGIEYGGTNNKHDDYLRDEFEKRICRPTVNGTNLHCDLWSTEEIGDYDEYGVDNLRTYDHCFKAFLSRCGEVDFLARVIISGHCSENLIEVFYTEDGKIHKIKEDDWAEPYSVISQ